MVCKTCPRKKWGTLSWILQWIEDGMPMDRGFSKYRGAVSWLIWGGDAAYTG